MFSLFNYITFFNQTEVEVQAILAKNQAYESEKHSTWLYQQ